MKARQKSRGARERDRLYHYAKGNADLIDLVGSPHDWYWTSIFMIPEHP